MRWRAPRPTIHPLRFPSGTPPTESIALEAVGRRRACQTATTSLRLGLGRLQVRQATAVASSSTMKSGWNRPATFNNVAAGLHFASCSRCTNCGAAAMKASTSVV